MAYVRVEAPSVKYDELIGGAQSALFTKNITITAGTALKRGTIVTAAGAMVGAADTAYGIIAQDVAATDTVATVYIEGVFNASKLIVANGDTVRAHEDQLRDAGILLSDVH